VILRDQLRVLRSHVLLVLVCLALALAAAVAVTVALPKTWQSETKLIVGNAIGANQPDYNAQLLAQQLSQTYSVWATTTPILEQVISQLGLQTTAKDLGDDVSAEAPRDLNIVQIKASADDPQKAAAIANAIADALVEAARKSLGNNPDIQSFVNQQIELTRDEIASTRKQIEALPSRNLTLREQQELTALQNQLASLNASYASYLTYATGSGANKLTVIEPARAADEPASPRPVVNLIAAIVVGLLVGVGLAFIRDHLDDSLKNPEQVSTLLGLPTLATIAKIPGLSGREPIYRLTMTVFPRSSAAESFRMLRTNLGFASVDRPLRLLSVTSAMPSEGKTLVAANLAVAFAQAGHETILVDTDLRKPEAHKLFGLPNTTGLTNLLRATDPSVDVALQDTVEPKLRLLASGPQPPNPAELLGSKAMANLIERLRKQAEIIVFDTPPLQAVTDAAVLAASLDGTVLVTHAGRTGRAAAQSAVDSLTRVGARPLGVVLNLAGKRWIDTYGYYAHPGDDIQVEAGDALVGGMEASQRYRQTVGRRPRVEAAPEEPSARS
jgi:tyrosine-protein kinase